MPVIRHSSENKVAHALATHGRMATSEWRHKIVLQKYFKDETTHGLIDSLCSLAERKINTVINSEMLRHDQKDANERDYFIKYLEQVRDGFNGFIGARDGESTEEREEGFNGLMSELYDIGDWKIELRDGSLQKFLWIG